MEDQVSQPAEELDVDGNIDAQRVFDGFPGDVAYDAYFLDEEIDDVTGDEPNEQENDKTDQ